MMPPRDGYSGTSLQPHQVRHVALNAPQLSASDTLPKRPRLRADTDTRWAAFSLGLILIIIGGAELFTGNTLIVMAWAEGRVGTVRLLRNWSLVYCGNFAGALGSALFVHWSGTLSLGDGAVGRNGCAHSHCKGRAWSDRSVFPRFAL